MKTYYVYILTNPGGMLYTGVTNDLQRRVHEHKTKKTPGYTSQYGLDRLVYFEETTDVHAALDREKEIKGWVRKKKLDLIRSVNPRFEDLSEAWFE